MGEKYPELKITENLTDFLKSFVPTAAGGITGFKLAKMAGLI